MCLAGRDRGKGDTWPLPTPTQRRLRSTTRVTCQEPVCNRATVRSKCSCSTTVGTIVIAAGTRFLQRHPLMLDSAIGQAGPIQMKPSKCTDAARPVLARRQISLVSLGDMGPRCFASQVTRSRSCQKKLLYISSFLPWCRRSCEDRRGDSKTNETKEKQSVKSPEENKGKTRGALDERTPRFPKQGRGAE